MEMIDVREGIGLFIKNGQTHFDVIRDHEKVGMEYWLTNGDGAFYGVDPSKETEDEARASFKKYLAGYAGQ